jgi:hypothetical protein
MNQFMRLPSFSSCCSRVSIRRSLYSTGVVSLRTQSQRRKDGGKVSDNHSSALPDPPRCGGRVSILGITIGGARPMSFAMLLMGMSFDISILTPCDHESARSLLCQ